MVKNNSEPFAACAAERSFDMEDKRILIADDEEGIRDMVKEYVSLDGFSVDEAADGEEALDLLAKNKYDLLLLDVMMPKVNGWTVLRKLRETSNLPVIMLTARGEEYDKLFGFELGADDYMIKPFSPKELLARMKAIIRRSETDKSDDSGKEVDVFGGLKIEYFSRNVYVDGELISLTPKEFELLSFFAHNEHYVFTREQLLSKVWGYDFYGDERTVDTHIKMLRDSLKNYRSYIVTVWGTGYKFETGNAK